MMASLAGNSAAIEILGRRERRITRSESRTRLDSFYPKSAMSPFPRGDGSTKNIDTEKRIRRRSGMKSDSSPEPS
jgi:hypothetical protein